MVDTSKINLAIESFDNWLQPWTFYNSVITHTALGELEKNTFEAMWSNANDKSLWLNGTLQTCCIYAERVIALNFN